MSIRTGSVLFMLLMSLVLIFSVVLPTAAVAADDGKKSAIPDVTELINRLPLVKLREMGALVAQLEAREDERLLPVFEALMEGKLYFVKSSKAVILLGDEAAEGNTFMAVSAMDGSAIANVKKSQVGKIRVNNSLRKQLRKAIARLTLFSSSPATRKQAVDRLMSDLDDDNIELLTQALAQEKNAGVRKKIRFALSVAALDASDMRVKKAAVSALSGEVHPEVRNRLARIVEKDDQGNYLEQDSELVKLALASIKKSDSRLQLYGFFERVFFGLSLGSVLLLAAIGLAITFGVMGVINMAHGELLMLGAYTTYVIQLLMPNHIGLSLFVAIPAAFVFCGLVGVAIERGVIQFLKGRPLETLLATFGLSLILQQTVRSIFSPLNRQVSTPEWMSGTLEITTGLSLTYNRLYIILFSLVVFGLLLLVMKKTALGLYVRAVSQNRDMARAVGIRSEWVDAMTFGLGSGIAGVAGVALSQLTNVGPNLGQSYIIDSFMVVVFGGVGNLWGTLVGAFSLGIGSKFLEPVTGTVLAQILVLVFIVLFIQKRPRGLFPQQGRSAEQ
ncbi:MAG: urea ABC transporter permease subunit UrtB [Pseudomonadales bacterium]